MTEVQPIRDTNQKTVTGAVSHLPVLMRVALLSLSSGAIFYSLGSHIMRTWDESIYAEVAKEMGRHGWLTPYWNFQPWFEKPPLFMWATAAMYRIFGVSEMSARMITALCGVATIWLTFEIGRRLMDDWGGLAAAGILLANTYFIFLSRFGTIDVPLALCCVVAAYGYLRAADGEQGWLYAVGVASGMGLMLKGAAGILVPLSISLALLLDLRIFSRAGRPRTQWRFGSWGSELRNSIFLALLIPLPWHLTMMILHGRAFLNEYIGFHVLARMQGIEGHAGPPYFYLEEYWYEFLPFALLALIGLCLCFGRKKDSSIVISFFLVITLSFSMVGTKLLGYAIPAFPFVALLAALGMKELSALCGPAMRRRYALAALALISFPLYWWFQSKHLDFVYGHAEDQVANRTSGFSETLIAQLSFQVRPAESEANPSPLIVCLDGAVVNKQQPLFYSGRPVIQAFLIAQDTSEDLRGRYFDPAPLETVVASRPAPIIIWTQMYPQLVSSDRYDFKAIAQRGLLTLGQISLR